MPKDGYTSITIEDESYDSIHGDYQNKKQVLKLNGIFSFSDYLESLSKNAKPTTVDDLKELLCILVQSQFTLNDLMLGVTREQCEKNHFNTKQHMFEFLKKFQDGL